MILPGGTLGVLGGGQFGRMFAAEASRMGFRVVVFDPDPEAPAGRLADRHIARPWSDPDALSELARICDAVTIGFDNVPAEVLRALAAHLPVRPKADAVSVTQDRCEEKRFLNAMDIPTVDWVPLKPGEPGSPGWRSIGAVAGILKTSRLGHGGKDQEIIASNEELPAAMVRLGSVPCILERRMALEHEISVMVARGVDGTVTTWPVAENVHRDGILHTSVVPAMIPGALAAEAGELAQRIVEQLDFVGVLGVEYFVVGGGRLLVNELAPRPHNSGHWTIDASLTSQFEQQVRVLTGLPLGATATLAPVAMVNLLGELWRYGEPHWERALAMPGVRVHLYGKRTPRRSSKMGHLTAIGDTPEGALDAALEAWTVLT